MPSQTTVSVSKVLCDLEITVIQRPSQISQLIRWLEEVAGPSKVLGIDTETTGLDPRENLVRLIQVASREAVLIVDLDGFRTGSQRCVNWEVPGLKDTSNYRSSSKHPQR